MKKINPTALFVILLCITAILLWCTLTKGHNWGDDFSAYIMQAKSIAEGTTRSFIETNRFTMENSSELIGPSCLPMGISRSAGAILCCLRP